MSAVRYSRLGELYWLRARGWDDRTARLGAYLHTCKHSTGEGYYLCPVAYMADDMDWTAAIAQKALTVLVEAGEFHYDWTRSVVFDPEALALQKPTTENQIKGAIARIRVVPLGPLLSVFYQHAVTHANGLAEAMAKEFHALIEQSMAMETRSHSNGNAGRIRMGGSRVA